MQKTRCHGVIPIIPGSNSHQLWLEFKQQHAGIAAQIVSSGSTNVCAMEHDQGKGFVLPMCQQLGHQCY
jgi:hypothetical protein